MKSFARERSRALDPDTAAMRAFGLAASAAIAPLFFLLGANQHT
jgi:hypothetical protein